MQARIWFGQAGGATCLLRERTSGPAENGGAHVDASQRSQAACAIITVLHPYAKHPCGLLGRGVVSRGYSQAGDSGRSLHVHLACHSFTQLLCCAVS